MILQSRTMRRHLLDHDGAFRQDFRQHMQEILGADRRAGRWLRRYLSARRRLPVAGLDHTEKAGEAQPQAADDARADGGTGRCGWIVCYLEERHIADK